MRTELCRLLHLVQLITIGIFHWCAQSPCAVHTKPFQNGCYVILIADLHFIAAIWTIAIPDMENSLLLRSNWRCTLSQRMPWVQRDLHCPWRMPRCDPLTEAQSSNSHRLLWRITSVCCTLAKTSPNKNAVKLSYQAFKACFSTYNARKGVQTCT